MSYIEIFAFNENGDSESIGEVQNAFRGCMAFWLNLEKKYLPSVETKNILMRNEYNSRLFCFNEEHLDEFWGLVDDERLSSDERLILLSTFDKVIIGKEKVPELIHAYKTTDCDCNLPQQAEIIERAFQENKYLGVAFNQTSVMEDPWTLYDDEKDESVPYNIFRDKGHKIVGD
jgi:hypothetical protein